jgi:hypothetical protein
MLVEADSVWTVKRGLPTFMPSSVFDEIFAVRALKINS